MSSFFHSKKHSNGEITIGKLKETTTRSTLQKSQESTRENFASFPTMEKQFFAHFRRDNQNLIAIDDKTKLTEKFKLMNKNSFYYHFFRSFSSCSFFAISTSMVFFCSSRAVVHLENDEADER